MDIVEALYFKYYLDRKLKKNSFDQVFEESAYCSQFADFMKTRIGQIWLNKPNGQKYQKWQNG